MVVARALCAECIGEIADFLNVASGKFAGLVIGKHGNLPISD